MPIRAWRSIARAPRRASTATANFREGFAGLAALGLSFDAWLFQTQLDDVTDLARAFPQATIVLNHVGGPLAIGPYAGKREEAFAAWKKSIGEVAAASPNTYVKLGGLGMKLSGFTFFNDEMPPSSQDLEKAWRPYIEVCIEAFGPQRSMFESNFPVDKGMCSYPVMWNAFKRIAAGCSATREDRAVQRRRDQSLSPAGVTTAGKSVSMQKHRHDRARPGHPRASAKAGRGWPEHVRP